MKYTSILLLLFSMIISTGCFEVIEEVILNNDGSGHITMTVNLSQSKTKLSSIMLMDSINNYKVPNRGEIERKMGKMIKEINGLPGVSNVNEQMDFSEYIFSVSCDFENVDALNNVITHFSTGSYKATSKSKKQFTFDESQKKFTRDYHYNLSRELDKVKRQDREVLQDATITTIHRFESDVTSSDNKLSKIAGNKKAVLLRVDVNDMISGSETIKNSITLQ